MDAPELETDSDALSDPLLSRAFGFELAENEWMGRLRGYCTTSSLGRIGPYEVIMTAGRGGQGLVYKARQPGTRREVAIKRLSAGIFSTPEMLARFQREVEAVAALNHPHIVTVFGSELVDGQPVLVMQWIDGIPFDRWARPMEGVTRPLPEVLDAFAKVCDAVHHAHQRGVIHRDLKPTNVLVDSIGEPHVLDFGLARRNDDSSSDPQLTLSGAVLGTPAFSPPEQLRGDARAVDERSDVYSLGAMLYCGLTGSTPVDSQQSHAAMAERIERVGPQSSALLNAALDREICAIVLKALQPEPAQRFQSVEALAEDVSRYQSGRPVLAHPPGAAYRLRKFVRRNGLALSVAAVVAGALAVAGSIAIHQSRRLTDALTRAIPEQGIPEPPPRPEADTLDNIQDVASLASKRFFDADYAGAEALFRRQLEQLRLAENSRPDEFRRVINSLCHSIMFQEHWADATPVVEEALRITLQEYGDTHRFVASYSLLLGTLRAKAGDAAGARAAFDKSHAILTALIDRERSPSCVRDLGSVLMEMGRLDDAEAALREALVGREARGSPNAVGRTGVAKVCLGDCLFRAGRMDEAERLLLEGQVLIGSHIDYLGFRLIAARCLVGLYEASGRAAEAAHWRECIARRPIREWGPSSKSGATSTPTEIDNTGH